MPAYPLTVRCLAPGKCRKEVVREITGNLRYAMPDSDQEEYRSIAEKFPRPSPIDRSRELRPWRRAYDLTGCALYWMPVASFPVPVGQKQWLMSFFDGLNTVLGEQIGLRPEVFLQFKLLQPDLMDPFLKNMKEFYPHMGLSRRPGTAIPEFPNQDAIMAMSKEILGKWKLPDATKFMPDYCYWFLQKRERRQRELFLGHGGLTVIYLKPDPNSKPPQLGFSPRS